MVYVIVCTEGACERQAREPLQPVPADGINIKPNNEGRKESNVGHQRNNSQDPFSVLVDGAKGEIRQEGKGQQQAAEETKDVGDVIDPWQEATDKEEEHHDEQLQKGPPWLLQDLPGLEQLNKQTSQESILGASWSRLQGGKSRESFGLGKRLRSFLTLLLRKPSYHVERHVQKTGAQRQRQ